MRARPFSASTQVIDDPSGSDLLMVMEFVEGGPLLAQRPDGSNDPIAEKAARNYFRQVSQLPD